MKLNATQVRSKIGPVSPAEAKARKIQKAADRIAEIATLEKQLVLAREDVKRFSEGMGARRADIYVRLVNVISRRLNALELQK